MNIFAEKTENPRHVGQKLTEVGMLGQDRLHHRPHFEISQESRDIY